MGKLTISMVIFHSYFDITRGLWRFNDLFWGDTGPGFPVQARAQQTCRAAGFPSEKNEGNQGEPGGKVMNL